MRSRRSPRSEFVNGGGTGSVERTSAEDAVTEVAAGSGLYSPALFDGYRAFAARPAVFFAVPVTRVPAPGLVTVAGGGWVASGPPAPTGSRCLPIRPACAGSPRRAPARCRRRCADGRRRLRVGDRVWFRHAKAGGSASTSTSCTPLEGDRLTGTVPDLPRRRAHLRLTSGNGSFAPAQPRTGVKLPNA